MSKHRSAGVAEFTTVYPDWYRGCAVHVHFKLRPYAGTSRSYEFTSQLFFGESVTDVVHSPSPYASRGARDTRNASDGIYDGLTAAQKAGLTLRATKNDDGSYAGAIALGVQVG